MSGIVGHATDYSLLEDQPSKLDVERDHSGSFRVTLDLSLP